MSISPDGGLHTDLTKKFPWEILIGFVGVCVTLLIFLYNVITSQITRIDNTVTTEFAGIHTHLDTIERSIGQIEGQIKKTDAAQR